VRTISDDVYGLNLSMSVMGLMRWGGVFCLGFLFYFLLLEILSPVFESSASA
jgi:hypothetical protein